MGFDVILVESFDGLFATVWILPGRWLIRRVSEKPTRRLIGSRRSREVGMDEMVEEVGFEMVIRIC